MTERIQRKRTKGWQMPENAIYVGRPTIWGNPFPLSLGRNRCLMLYRLFLRRRWKDLERLGQTEGGIIYLQVLHVHIMDDLPKLCGKDLACWCPLKLDNHYVPCHADVLLKLVNNMTMKEVRHENLRRTKGKAL